MTVRDAGRKVSVAWRRWWRTTTRSRGAWGRNAPALRGAPLGASPCRFVRPGKAKLLPGALAKVH